MRRPPVLSTEEADCIMAAEHSVPPCWKDRFLAHLRPSHQPGAITDAAIVVVSDTTAP
jgi:hypothetical protein